MEALSNGLSGQNHVAAGPSRVSTPRRVNLRPDSSDDDEDGSPSPLPTVTNGISKRKRHDIVNGESSKQPHKKVTREEIQKRRDMAAKLLETRRDLPFYQARRKIVQEILDHDTTIILGETGCGKSTQLPQLLRTHPLALAYYSPNGPDAPRHKRGPSIAITQPRRLPAIALANRVAAETGCGLGGEVGYAVRFEEAVSRSTRVKYLTEGVLMRELAGAQSAPANEDIEGPSHTGLDLLLRYDVIVIDEAHERTLNTDFLCGALKRVQRMRKELAARRALRNGHVVSEKGKEKADEPEVRELKIVVMSATLDPAKFLKFFNTGRDALLVKGRMYDVHVHHASQPPDEFVEAAARQVMQIHCAKPERDGDVLVFMPGSEEIEECVELLKRVASELPDKYMKMQVLPLYSTLPPTAQAKIFSPTKANTRRIIVATNIAETSITIPGVVHVVDAGFKKEKQYIFRNSGSIEHLKKTPISQAAAWQRTGRAGRERAGECYRMYTKAAYNSLVPFDQPEIQRVNLDSAVLQLVSMGIDPGEFEYIDNPGRDPIAAAMQTLAGLGALDSPTSVSILGRQMLRYPLDPPKARILIASFELGCVSEIIDLLSLIDAGNLFIDKASERDALAAARSHFLHKDGDHLTNLAVFRTYIEVKKRGEPVLKWCRDNHVNSRTLSNAVRVRDQLRDLVRREGKDWQNSCGSDTDVVLKSLLQGLFMNTAVIQADGTYKQTLGGMPVKIHPSSVLMSKKVPAILYDELTITNNIYARSVSAFDNAWLAEIPWFKQATLTTDVAHPVGKRSV